MKYKTLLSDYIHKHKDLCVLLIHIMMGVAIYINSLSNAFVGDDITQIVNNESVHNTASIPKFFTSSTFYNGTSKLVGVYYKPLLSTYFTIEYALFGQRPWGYHLTQILLHVACGFLVYLLFKKYFHWAVAAASSMVFLVHPANSEAVLYISATQEQLFLIFGLVSLLLIDGRSAVHTIVSGILLLFSMLSKETGVLFVCIYICMVSYSKNIYKLRNYIVSILAVIIYVFARYFAIGLTIHSMNAPIDRLPTSARFMNIPVILVHYIRLLVFPLSLASSYQWAYVVATPGNFMLPVLLLAIVVILISTGGYFVWRSVGAHRYRDAYILFSTWLIIGLGIHSQIVPLDSTAAERWMYFPSIGLIGIVAALYSAGKYKHARWIAYITMMIVLVFAVRSYVRSYDWRDEMTLDAHDIYSSPNTYNLESALAYQLLSTGNYEEARAHAELSDRLFPSFVNTNNLGIIYLHLNEFELAKKAYLRSLKMYDYYLIYENIAEVIVVGNTHTKADDQFMKSVTQKYPKDSKILFYKAIYQYRRGDQGAIDSINQAYKLTPSDQIGTVRDMMINHQPLDINFDF